MNAQIQFLFPYFRAHRAKLIFAFLIATLSVLLDHVSPWMLKLLIDRVQNKSSTGPSLFYIFAAVTLAIIASGLLGYWQRIIVAEFSRSLENSIRQDLFRRLLHQSLAFSGKVLPGEILTNLVQDLDKLQELVGPAMLHLFRTGFTLLASTLLLYLLSPSLALFGFCFFVILALASLRLMGLVYAGHRRTQKAQGSLNGFVRDYLHGISVAKSSGGDDYFAGRLANSSAEVRDATRSIATLSAAIWPAVTLLCGAGIACAVAWGSYQVQKGSLEVGSLAAAILYLVRAQYPLVGLGIMAAMFQRGRASLDRILDLRNKMDAEIISNPEPDAPPLPPFEKLEMRNLTFDFGNPDRPALAHIDLVMEPGKSVGIVGDTGVGKTTLAKLICGELVPPPGTLFINGMDSCTLHDQDPHGSWRAWFGYAPQDGFLFSWSIADNISFGGPEVDPAEVLTAAEHAGLSHDLTLLPHGLDSILGEKGVNLSGGQRQRVGLARAFLSGAPVLVLDDVLSAVDPATEQRVVNSIRRDRKKHALLIISHRYTTLSHCDEILYLENGAVVERGTHQELLALQGRYAKSWALQVLEVEP